MAKQGFGGQWVPVAKIGEFTDSEGIVRDLNRTFLSEVIANYNASEHEAPAVIGHPRNDAPAFGWVSGLRLNGQELEARFADTDDEFERLVESGRYKKRSAAFYLQSKNPKLKTPTVKHIGFLGAAPPSLKGMRDIQFAEGESFVLEEIINLQETQMKDEDFDQLPESTWDKIKAKLGITAEKRNDPGEAGAQFSEASMKTMITEAVAEATGKVKTDLTADFTEKLKEKDDQITELKTKVDGQISGGKRAEIVSFVEGIPAERGKHFLKRAGIVEFMEALADADAAGKDPAICFSEGEGDKKEEHKFSRVEWFKNYVDAQKAFVEFGEKFGNITATKEADAMINSGRVDAMKKAAGVEKKEGGKD